MVTGPARILITGSRSWAAPQLLADVLLDTWHDAVQLGHDGLVVVHGAADGADTLAAQWAAANGQQTDPHPVTRDDWDTCAPDCPPGHRRPRRGGTTFCPSAGHRRNQRMVDAGAALVLAFVAPCTSATCPRPAPHDSHGATDCIRRAEAAQLPVRRITP